MHAFRALYRDMPVRVYNDTPASDVSVQFNHGILPCPAGVVECQSFRPLSCSAPFPFGLLPVRPPSIHKVIRSEVSWVTWHVDLFGLYQRSPAQPCELTSALIVMVIHKLSSTLQPLVSEMTCSAPISDSLFAPQSSPVCKCCLAYSC